MFPAIQSTAKPSGVASPYWITTSKLVKATRTDKKDGKNGQYLKLIISFKLSILMRATMEITLKLYCVFTFDNFN